MRGYHPSSYCAENDVLPEMIMRFKGKEDCLPPCRQRLSASSVFAVTYSLFTRLSLVRFSQPWATCGEVLTAITAVADPADAAPNW